MAEYVQLNIPVRRTHWVYRIWAADGTCLYVGMTSGSWLRRLGEHFHKPRSRREPDRQRWDHEIDRIDLAEFPTRAAAAEEELAQIRALMPRENRHLKGKYIYGVGRRDETFKQYQNDRYQADPEMRERIKRQRTAWRESNRERNNEIARDSWHKRRAEMDDEELQRRRELHNQAVRRWRRRRKEEAS